MAVKRPLVVKDGTVMELEPGDRLYFAPSTVVVNVDASVAAAGSVDLGKVPVAVLTVSHNGLVLQQGVDYDYVIDGQLVVFQPGVILTEGDTVAVTFV